MKKLLVLSGKGGTGKTTVASAFIALSTNVAAADCDVDAPNLHLTMSPTKPEWTRVFYGMDKAYIDSEKCIECGICAENCRFNAIDITNSGEYQINVYACEGCGVCDKICPQNAIALQQDEAGITELLNGSFLLSTAILKMGRGNSGKLVTEVKNQLKEFATHHKIAVIDGSPGIGCPVIASLSGVDLVLLVAEPSVSGIHDLKRIVKTAQSFQIPIAACVNKYDVNSELTKQIKEYCHATNIYFTGEIPYDSTAVKAANSRKSIMEYDCPAQRAIADIYKKTVSILQEDSFYENCNCM